VGAEKDGGPVKKAMTCIWVVLVVGDGVVADEKRREVARLLRRPRKLVTEQRWQEARRTAQEMLKSEPQNAVTEVANKQVTHNINRAIRQINRERAAKALAARVQADIEARAFSGLLWEMIRALPHECCELFNVRCKIATLVAAEGYVALGAMQQIGATAGVFWETCELASFILDAGLLEGKVLGRGVGAGAGISFAWVLAWYGATRNASAASYKGTFRTVTFGFRLASGGYFYGLDEPWQGVFWGVGISARRLFPGSPRCPASGYFADIRYKLIGTRVLSPCWCLAAKATFGLIAGVAATLGAVAGALVPFGR